MIVGKFKKDNSLSKRQIESSRIVNKYPDRIPIIVEVSCKNNEIVLDKYKYLVPHDLVLSQFIFVIRKRIKLSPETALFILINNTMQAATSTMGMIYKEHKDKDGFLYAVISLENTFGNKQKK